MFKALIYFNASIGHDIPGHYENRLRVTIPNDEIKEHFPSEQIKEIERISYDDFFNLVNFSHGQNMFRQFNKKREITCTQCYFSYRGDICPKCSSTESFWNIDSDTYITEKTLDCLHESISAICNSIDSLNEFSKYRYLLIRPPGHHCHTRGSGFCPLNNSFIAAQYANSKGYQKVLILDWDIHHADGTQGLVKSKTWCSLISIHGYGTKKYRFYPGTGNTSENDKNILNIPLLLENENSRLQYNDSYYMHIMENQVDTFIKDFNPSIIIISNGLDAHREDYLAGMNLTSSFYKQAVKKLKSYNIPLIFILEGGYNPIVVRDTSIVMIQELEK